jgi:hypothetical protein
MLYPRRGSKDIHNIPQGASIMLILVSCGTRDRTKKKPFSLSSMDVVKGDYRINIIRTWDRLQLNDDGLTICDSCIPHS